MTQTILVVDDEQRIEMLFTLFFDEEIEGNEYEFIFAYDGDDALNKLRKNKNINLVLTDINMPNKNGFELIESMKELNFNQPVIVISAYDQEAYKNRAFELGATEFIVKPIDFPNLKNILINLIIEN
jgi:YesN/AraC family two-component response regulator